MDALQLFVEKFIVETTDGKRIHVYMDLYRLPSPHEPCFPEGYKFSWIAFEDDFPEDRVLFDCHAPKGPHMHIGSGSTLEAPFEWHSLSQAKTLFYSKVIERFGEIPELRRDMQ